MSRQGDELRRKLARDTGRVKAELTIEIAANLDREMPVDTGWARANTIPSVGAPVTAPVGSPDSIDTGAAAAGAAEVLANQRPDADLYVSNHVPYVSILDATHPTAAGMIERSIEQGVATVRARVAARKVEL